MGSITPEQYWADQFRQASKLLLDENLVWSIDFEPIRVPLGRYLNRCADRGEIQDFYIVQLVQYLNKGA